MSKLYRDAYEREGGRRVEHTLIWDNHSEVMFDPKLIPPEQLEKSE